MMESVGDEYGDRAAEDGATIDQTTGGTHNDWFSPETESPRSGMTEGADSFDAAEPSDEELPAAEPIFESVERDLNGGPQIP